MAGSTLGARERCLRRVLLAHCNVNTPFLQVPNAKFGHDAGAQVQYCKAKNLYSSSEVGTVADSLYVLVFASSEAIHFFSQPLLTAKFAF